jgi:hypothetical protein
MSTLQVVPSIILSVFSAAAGIGQLLLTGTADLMEPAVNGVLALTETSKDTVRRQPFSLNCTTTVVSISWHAR